MQVFNFMSENLQAVGKITYLTLYIFQLNKILKGNYPPSALIGGRV